MTVRTEGGRPPPRTSSASADGTVLTSVTSDAAGSPASASALSATITAPPDDSGTKSSKIDRSKLVEVENRTPASSAGEYRASAHSTRRRALPCGIATPLGTPVDPDV